MKKSIVAGSLFAAMGSMPLAAESALDKLAGKGQEAAAAVEASANEAVSGITPAFWIAPVCAIVALIVAIICYKLMIKALITFPNFSSMITVNHPTSLSKFTKKRNPEP